MNHKLVISLVALSVCAMVWMIGWLGKKPHRMFRAYLGFTGGLTVWAASDLLLHIGWSDLVLRMARTVWSLGWPVLGYLAFMYVSTWLRKKKTFIHLVVLSVALVSIPLWLFEQMLTSHPTSSRFGGMVAVMTMVNLGFPAAMALVSLYQSFYGQPPRDQKSGWVFLITGMTSLLILPVFTGGLGESGLLAPMLIVASLGALGSKYFDRLDADHSVFEARDKAPMRPTGGIHSLDGTQGEPVHFAWSEQSDQTQQSQRMEALGRLAGGVAHDFNNLLSAILGFAGIIKESLDPDDELQEDVNELLVAARRAASLTRQLLAFSRRENNAPEVLNPNEIVEELEKMLKRIIGEDIVLITELADDCWPVMMDRGQLEQILVNLVVNARDAMPVGGRLTIETSNIGAGASEGLLGAQVQPGRYVCMRIRDNGIGIPSDILEHVFEPFISSKPFGKGTGLGLATVYGIVKQTGGEIKVSSKAGEGACFDLFFPAARADEAREARVMEVPSRVVGTETVLLVEDDRAVRTLAARILSQKGYQVLEAENGEKAVELSQHHDGPIHLLLADMIMPGMNGKECAEQVLATRRDTRVLFMSGYTDDVLAQRGLLDNGFNFLEKPIEADKLLSKMVSVLYVSNN